MPRVIMCDYDGKIPARLIRRIRWVLYVAVACRAEWVRIDRTRRGYHVCIRVNRNLSMLRVILVQALLGSDWRRETFNARRASRMRYVGPFWRERVNTLYYSHHRSVRV